MEARMLAIWSNIRNIVNILFVLVLLAIAFYNVLGLGESYHIKTILPKFIIALIAVNFSFLAVKVVLDGVNVVTTAIFALPDAVEEGMADNPINDTQWQKTICESIYGDTTEEYLAAMTAKRKEGEKIWCETDKTLIDEGKFFFSRFDGQNAAAILAINFAKITELNKVTIQAPSLKNLTLNIAFSMALYVVYATAFIALFVLLLVRLVVLWVTIVLSPLIALKYVLPEAIKGSVGGEFTTKLVKNIWVPIPIALVLTIGFIMLKGLQAAHIPDIGLESSTLGMKLLFSGVSTLQEVIVAVGTVAVVWLGVKTASSDTFASSAIDKIYGAVGTAGKFALTAWKYLPIIPVMKPGAKEAEKISLAGLAEIGEFPSAMERKAREKARGVLGLGEGGLDQSLTNMDKNRTTKDFRSTLAGIDRSDVGSEKVQKQIAKTARSSAAITRDLRLPSDMKDKSGNKITSRSQLLEKMRNGQVHEDTMKEIHRLNTAGVAKPKPAAAKPAAPGAPPTQAGPPAAKEAAALAVGAAAATKMAGSNYDPYKATLTKEEQAAVEAYAKDKSEASLKNAQVAFKKIEKMAEGAERDAFHTDIGKAARASSAEDQKTALAAAIDKRKKTLTDKEKGPGLDETQSTVIIASELKKYYGAMSEADKKKVAAAAKAQGIDL